MTAKPVYRVDIIEPSMQSRARSKHPKIENTPGGLPPSGPVAHTEYGSPYFSA